MIIKKLLKHTNKILIVVIFIVITYFIFYYKKKDIKVENFSSSSENKPVYYTINNVNCVFGRIPHPTSSTLASGGDHKFMGDFNSLEACIEKVKNDPDGDKIQAVTWHDASFGSWAYKCHGITDKNTRVDHGGVHCARKDMVNDAKTCRKIGKTRLPGGGWLEGGNQDHVDPYPKITSSADECRNLCESKPDCMQYVRYRDGACYMMNKIYDRTRAQKENTDFTSGVCTTGSQILGVGTDNKLYLKKTLADPWQFQGNNSCCVIGITQLHDGRLCGIGTNLYLYVKDTLTSDWQFVNNNSCCVIAITQMSNGDILGAGTNNKLYIKKNINAIWEYVSYNPGEVKAIIELQDGRIACVGMNNHMWIRENLSSDWGPVVPQSCCVIGLAQLDSGILLGIGTDGTLWSKDTSSGLNGPWIGPYKDSCCIKAICTYSNSLKDPTLKPPHAKKCDWKDTSYCIFKDYTKNGDTCMAPSSTGYNYNYSVPGLYSYDQKALEGWLKALYERDGGSDKTKSERANVADYVDRCKSETGYEFLKNLDNYFNCDWRINNSCIFPDYRPSGFTCFSPGNGADNYGGLNTYSQGNLMEWLRALYNRNAGKEKGWEKAEANNVYKYYMKCKDREGYEFLKSLNLEDPIKKKEEDDKFNLTVEPRPKPPCGNGWLDNNGICDQVCKNPNQQLDRDGYCLCSSNSDCVSEFGFKCKNGACKRSLGTSIQYSEKCPQ